MQKNYSTTNLRLAVCLTALGVPLRDPDPVTQHAEPRPHDPGFTRFTFWFRVIDEDALRQLVAAFMAFEARWECLLDHDHPLYFIYGALFNRDVLIKHMRESTPFRVISEGDQTVLMPVHAPAWLVDKVKEHLRA